MDWTWGHHPGADNGLGVVFMIIWWVIAVGGITAIVVALTRGKGASIVPPADAPPTQAPGLATARSILDDRLARGDIEVAEYKERVAALEGD